VAGWLTEEWAGEAAALVDLLPPADGLTGTFSLAIGLGPRKEVALHWSYQDGAPEGGGPGADPDADVSLTLAATDALDLFGGAVEPSVSYMRGRLKASGDGSRLLGFLSSTGSKQYQKWRSRVGALAEETSGSTAG
jgi:SCP-2 sterol transfer family